MAAGSILVVDDDPNIRSLLRLYLERDRHRVTEAADGLAALAAATDRRFDLVLLDVMLPGMDGMEVCRRLRATSDVPIILLTARSGDPDKVAGLDLGADDYVVKPFSPRELMARVRSRLRRQRPPETAAPLLVGDGLRLDPNAVRVDLDGEPIELTATEFRLLRVLMERPSRVFTRDDLIGAVHGDDDPGISDRTIDVHVGRLRRKLDATKPGSGFIDTVRSVGYRFARPVERRSGDGA